MSSWRKHRCGHFVVATRGICSVQGQVTYKSVNTGEGGDGGRRVVAEEGEEGGDFKCGLGCCGTDNHHLESRSFPPGTITFRMICYGVLNGLFSSRAFPRSHSRVLFKLRSSADSNPSSHPGLLSSRLIMLAATPTPLSMAPALNFAIYGQSATSLPKTFSKHRQTP